MNLSLPVIEKYLLLLVLPLGIVDLALMDLWAAGACFALAVAVAVRNKPIRAAAVRCATFLVAFLAYRVASFQLGMAMDQAANRVLADRFALMAMVLILLVQSIAVKQPAFSFAAWPDWSGAFDFGRLRRFLKPAAASRVLLAAGLAAAAAIVAVAASQNFSHLGAVSPLALSVVAVGAALEELVWRDMLFGALRRQLGDGLAAAVSSAGYGLQCLALGFGLPFVAAFGLAGWFLARLTVRTKSIGPAIAFHALLGFGLLVCGVRL